MSYLKKLVNKISQDKKDHNILGDIVNPIIYIFSIILLGVNSGFHYGFLICLIFHFGIEIIQLVTKTGKFEVLDALSGSYSAILIYLAYIF